MTEFKHLTLLHSDDLHGAFLAEEVDGKPVDSLSRLSGYVQQARKQDTNVVCLCYCGRHASRIAY